ncbi:hypothetical protein BKA63DRAFT_299325 [Paraphoma chrysanthemicola]|nr:hypothetical protein BKA63DRAFT_299325 [Paraphoma chrysanthemicola]
MKTHGLAAAFILIGSCRSKPSPQIDSLVAEALSNLQAQATASDLSNSSCNADTAVVRREWSTLSEPQKRNYIDAVLCLGKKPARTPAAIAAGAKSRYDDFVVTHIQQTRTIHFTGNFLAWHRYYVWSYEHALHSECGYEGSHPYYNWAQWAEDPRKSPLFDGSDTSLSGDGAYLPGRNGTCVPTDASCFVRLEPADGGGCLNTGPFKNWTINLGPVQTVWPNIPPNPQSNGLGYNPRCLSRELNPQASQSTTEERVVSLILDHPDIASFQDTMQYVVPGDLGIHGGGHYTIGGDAGGDLFNSPADPAFFMHHAMIDLVWWTWQSLGFGSRDDALAGTTTFMNNPPSRNTTLQDVIDLGYVGVPNVTIAEVMSTLGGPLCYVYA